MAVDCVLISEMVSGIPSRGVELNGEWLQLQRRFEWVATFDVAVPVATDEKFAIPALIRDHSGGRTFDTRLCICVLYLFDSSRMVHGSISYCSVVS